MFFDIFIPTIEKRCKITTFFYTMYVFFDFFL